MRLRSKFAVAAATATMTIGISAAAVVANGSQAPPRTPAWVTADGHGVDRSKLPARVPVAGADGKIKLGADGKPVTVDPRALRPALQPPAETATAPVAGGEAVPEQRGVPAAELRRP